MDLSESDLLTRNQAAAILRCSPQNITMLVQRGNLPGVKRGTAGGRGHLFVPKQAVLDYVKTFNVKPPAQSA